MSIKLTQAQVRELFDYDSENGILIRKTFKSGKRKPCGHRPILNGYGYVKIHGKKYLAHRIIWFWYYDSMPNGEIDHIDRDRINNRIENLRVVSRTENLHNCKLSSNNTSGFPGVTWDKQRNKYRAQIRADNKLIRLGQFAAAEEAYLAYQLAKIELYPSSPIAQEYLKELTFAG